MRVDLATSFEEALRIKAERSDVVPVAGGTDLLVHWPDAHALQERDWLDLSALTELSHIHFEPDTVVLGALATYWDVIQDQRFRALPLLPAAAATVGSLQIQTRGTWAGNIANASPAADGVPALMVYDAEVQLASTSGRRSVPLADFYHGYKQLEARPEELIESIRVPLRPHDFENFTKVGSRAAQAITKVGMAVAHSAAGWRIVANSMAPTVRRCRTLERLVESGGTVDSPDGLLSAIRADVNPIDDIRSTAAYRERVFSRLLYQTLLPACSSFS